MAQVQADVHGTASRVQLGLPRRVTVLPQQLHLLVEKIIREEKDADGADYEGTPFSILDASPRVLSLYRSL